MNVTQRGVIALLKSAVTGQAQLLPVEFDLESAYKCINKHQMTALAYEGAVLCGVDPKLPVMQRMFQIYCRAMQISERQMAQFARICQAFDEAEVDYMPVKGCCMKALYRKPELRTMGDADILIRVNQYDTIKPIMEGLGFEKGAESDHELVWTIPGLKVELHKRLVPSYDKDYYAYYGEGWRLAKEKNGTCYAMIKEDQMVYLLTHFAKHFRGGGIGCRYVVDLWVYRRANPDLNEEYIEAELDKLQLKQFYRNVLALIDCWFTDGDETDTLEIMTEYIFASGSWGPMDKRLTASVLRESKQSKFAQNGKLVYLMRLVFPRASAISHEYKILQKAPWLLPVIWLIRPFHKVLIQGKKLSKKKQELQTIDQDNLLQQQKFLNSVGLDFHF